jgi:threonine 3-dehydrogenase
MSTTMQALAKTTAGPGLEMIEVPEPEPGIDEVLIRVDRASICGTDVHIDLWDPWAASTIKPPTVIGHEFVGRVAKVGSNVSGIDEGELVSGEGHVVCGRCRNCLAGRRHLCPHTLGVGVNRDGAFAEYLCIPATNVWKADPRIPLDVLSCFDPLGNATHTALSFPLLGEDVLITGAGPIGCMAAGICRYAGARHVVVTDVNDARLELAARMGASRTVNVARDDLREAMAALEMREGFDVGLEMSGNPAALTQMIDHMFAGGSIALLGIYSQPIEIDWNKMIFKALHLKGIYGREMYETWYKMTMMVLGGLDITPVITHRFAFARWRDAFDLMESGQSGKVVLCWNDPEEDTP